MRLSQSQKTTKIKDNRVSPSLQKNGPKTRNVGNWIQNKWRFSQENNQHRNATKPANSISHSHPHVQVSQAGQQANFCRQLRQITSRLDRYLKGIIDVESVKQPSSSTRKKEGRCRPIFLPKKQLSSRTAAANTKRTSSFTTAHDTLPPVLTDRSRCLHGTANWNLRYENLSCDTIRSLQSAETGACWAAVGSVRRLPSVRCAELAAEGTKHNCLAIDSPNSNQPGTLWSNLFHQPNQRPPHPDLGRRHSARGRLETARLAGSCCTHKSVANFPTEQVPSAMTSSDCAPNAYSDQSVSAKTRENHISSWSHSQRTLPTERELFLFSCGSFSIEPSSKRINTLCCIDVCFIFFSFFFFFFFFFWL